MKKHVVGAFALAATDQPQLRSIAPLLPKADRKD